MMSHIAFKGLVSSLAVTSWLPLHAFASIALLNTLSLKSLEKRRRKFLFNHDCLPILLLLYISCM